MEKEIGEASQRYIWATGKMDAERDCRNAALRGK